MEDLFFPTDWDVGLMARTPKMTLLDSFTVWNDHVNEFRFGCPGIGWPGILQEPRHCVFPSCFCDITPKSNGEIMVCTSFMFHFCLHEVMFIYYFM